MSATMTPEQEAKMREEFEKAALHCGKVLPLSRSGEEYIYDTVELQWQMWQAACGTMQAKIDELEADAAALRGQEHIAWMSANPYKFNEPVYIFEETENETKLYIFTSISNDRNVVCWAG